MYKIGALTRALLTRRAWGSATTQELANGSNGAHPPLAPADFERALTINDRYSGLTVNVPEMPFWLTGGAAFVYRRTSHGKRQFMLVEVATGVKRPPFDQARLAAGLNRASHKRYQADDLPFDHFELSDHDRRLDFQIENVRWSCDLASYDCTRTTSGLDAPGLRQLSHPKRDGHEHLYLFDGRTGALKNQITCGEWVVRGVNRVDPVNRQIWFEASGMNPGEDPYFVHAYRIGFDGKGLTELTPEPANHHIEFSPDGRYYVDLWSRIDLPPSMALYRASDDAKLMQVETADLSELVAAGWQPPLGFHAKGRDGKTDIWGVIHLPANFDPNKKYPVVENIYAGPQGSFVPKSFSRWIEPLTQLGFVVAQIDGMGTNNRSRAFHDVAWKNLKDAGFPDRILWHTAAAAMFPWYDVSNVGIFGTSAGGQSAVGALLFHPKFYKAAVANSGCYDNRIDKIWWNELWMGWPVGIEYSQSSAIDNAHRLQGKLMIVVGEMDHNVDPSSAFQLADRLIKAGKDFDMVYVPGAGHGTPGTYAQLKLLDFFVRNILGQTPPNWNTTPLELQKARHDDDDDR